jgi:hypothetical protein
MRKTPSLRQIRKANQAAGGCFFHKSHTQFLKEWGGVQKVIIVGDAVLVRTVFPKSYIYPEGRQYDYRFDSETGWLAPAELALCPSAAPFASSSF